ncbi:glycoside hydrolase family 3 protein [Rhizopus microsporus ATCC 52813]|uniref:Probable beta-glucosidase G n=1 Tax=Rhizopus microsporus ATCC 52813 TaxID=1340429 RepID=A0A2G4SMP7_RHIZD|nr:glycoside hydrolase family 3 protein [Rhizopus microsporus ATCC 52813]PHZ09656.1 glycoside hydrolase family 3 protein [Rhizopus microsporus ATCC 52813]
MARALVDKMSLEQKVNITTGIGWEKGPCLGNTYAISNPDFPSLCLQDAPLGVRFAYNVTSGVAGINAAASFDRNAIYERGVYMGQEFRGKGAHIQLGPAMNFMRSPEGGRGWESGGEDPFLTGVLTEQTVLGIQSQGVIATAKHYILNEQELHRTTGSSEADERTLHEIYLWPFARAIEAGVGSVMCSYNQINGIFACENDYLLNTVLKGELGFKGFVQSDWSATMSTVDSANHGLDMTMPGDITMGSSGSYFGKNLTDAVRAKKVPESRVTDMATRIVAAWYKLGQDKGFPETTLDSFHLDKAPYVNVQSDHYKLVRTMGAASTVLLKNNGILPLSKSIKNVAFVGSDAAVNPDGINACDDHSCNKGTLAQGWGSGTAFFPYLIDPISGLRNALGEDVKFTKSLDDWNLDAAAAAAKVADVAFVFSSADSGEEYKVVDGNVGDRNNLSLWNNGDNLIKAVADANKNTVVVIHSVGPVLMPWIDHPNIKAVVWPGLPGQESGNSLADVVTGKVNPSGRLPYTIAKKASDYPIKPDPAQNVVYKEKLLMGYKWFDAHNVTPLFPFGHGLSYTSFTYSGLTVKVDVFGKSIKVSVTVTIKNTGHLDGAEIPQLYLSFPESANEPPKLLRGFEKVFIKADKEEEIRFELTSTELSIWDTDSKSWVVPSGKFTAHVGASSRDIRQSADFVLLPGVQKHTKGPVLDRLVRSILSFFL